MLILVNAACFALQLIAYPFETGLASSWLRLDMWFGFQPAAFLHGFLWMPFTYQFLHGGLLHLFMNMLWLFVFGPDVERLLELGLQPAPAAGPLPTVLEPTPVPSAAPAEIVRALSHDSVSPSVAQSGPAPSLD